jgi:hypothetical protein
MNYILRTLILASIMYAPGVLAMQHGQAIQTSYLNIKKSFESIKQHPSPDCASVYRDLLDLQGHVLNLVPTAATSGVENLDQQTKALRDELQTWTKYSYSAIKARFEKLKAKSKLNLKDKSNLSRLRNNEITNIIIEGHTEQERQALCAEITKWANEKAISVLTFSESQLKTEFAAGSTQAPTSATAAAQQPRVATAIPSQTNASVPELSTSFAPVASSTAPSTSSVAPAQAQSAAAQKDVVTGKHIEAIPLTAEQRAEEIAQVAAQAKLQAQATVAAHAHASSSATQATSSVSSTASTKPAVAPVSAPVIHPQLHTKRKTSLSWLKKLGFGALAGSTVYVLYALLNVYAGTTKSMIGYNSLSWFGRKLWLI